MVRGLFSWLGTLLPLVVLSVNVITISVIFKLYCLKMAIDDYMINCGNAIVMTYIYMCSEH